MNQTETSMVYQIIAYLLRYPNKEMVDVLPELQEEIEAIHDEQIKDDLKQFMAQISECTFDSWISHYIENFDFGKLTNLYVTYLHLGEQRERGLELLKLKKFYEGHGFEVTDKELPDYLPLMLEFCGNVPINVSNELLEMHGKSIQTIREKIVESKSYYFLLFEALVKQMKRNGVALEGSQPLEGAGSRK